MRITGFQAENFKRLKVIEIDPDDHTVVIAGRNAQGKSSVLDGIWAALAGKAGQKELARPIRDGARKASVTITLDDLRIERKWTASGSTLTVGPKDGSAKFSSPQSILDKLIGSLSFDPLAFAEADAKTQRKTLLEVTGMADALEQVEVDRRQRFAERTEINRELKRYQSQIDGLPVGSDVKTERVDTAALAAELAKAYKRADLGVSWHHLRREIDKLEARLAEVEAEGRALGGSRPVADLEAAFATADETNQMADHYMRWVELSLEVEDASATSERLTRNIEACDEQKTALLNEADLPVEGLSVDEDGVLLNGIPFVQASAAERLKVSVAMAMAANPEVRVICIKDASLLDADSRAMLAAMAVEHDYQIWYEVVGDGGPTGIVIEDGEVA